MPGERDNRAVTYLTDEEVSKLKETSNEVGKSQSTLLREAVREYLDLDRGDRVERQLAQLTDEVADLRTALEADQTHTHSNGGLSSVSHATDGGIEYTAENVDEVSPPKTNAAVTKKVDYLAAKVRARKEQRLHREKFRELEVKKVWDYADDDRADALVQKTIDRLGFKQHPQGLPLYMDADEYDLIEQELEQDAEAAADAELEELSADD